MTVWVSFFLLAGFLSARALLSVATIVWGMNLLRGVPVRDWFRNWWWLTGALWVALYALSFFWSEDVGEWGDHTQVKLPFLLLPLAAPFFPRLSRRQWSVLVCGIFLILLSGVWWSVRFFLADPEGVVAGYNYSHTLPTPVYGDHICFSAALAVSVALLFAAWKKINVMARVIGTVCALIFTAYLHLLAAKTGLAMLYLLAFALVVRSVVRGAWLRGLTIGSAGIALVVLAYNTSPTFRSRAGYVYNSFREYNAGNEASQYSDPNRLISYDIAVRLLAEQPGRGWGAGSMRVAMSRGYDRWYPYVAEENRLIPHNQFLASAVAVGVPGMLLLVIWWSMSARGLPRNRERGYAIIGWTLLTIPLLVDPSFEIQFGVAVYLFFLLLFRALAQEGDAFTVPTGISEHDEFHPDFSAQPGSVSGRSA